MVRFGWVALGGVLASFAACVGDDAVPTAPAPDASTDAAPVSDSSTAEGGATPL